MLQWCWEIQPEQHQELRTLTQGGGGEKNWEALALQVRAGGGGAKQRMQSKAEKAKYGEKKGWFFFFQGNPLKCLCQKLNMKEENKI